MTSKNEAPCPLFRLFPVSPATQQALSHTSDLTGRLVIDWY